ncbi:alcohol dehydrogenase catalytic domain-containing protein [Micromonospora sp. R77]|uniref:alcohol dehydrogenase catalytic domain-containing protein n=1 Tax=Micromonospora sp. R77 TaxID=2925836 RepID=UPI001F61E64A|nr:alcohol dehydrogenase catalytic domain-containing protein [Micromonospora sp. R77]MCI4061247.1 alcohol dehydrogenase catalytic domain-containing protein [Micromonospora sp. R77]
MRAAVVPGVRQRWELREVPTPRPGPGEVLIRVRASGVCGNDVWLTDGTYPYPEMDPTILGHEPAGEVVEVGPGVTSRRVGDRVGATWVQGTCGTCAYCRLQLPLTGQSAMNCAAPAMTGMTRQGGHAEFIAVPADSTVLLPPGLSYELAAPMLCAGYTAWSALRAADPQPHERVAVLGIGGLGHLAVQFSRACGFETVAVTGTPDKHDLVRKLGADLVVGDGDELRDSGGADVVVVTGTSFAAATRALSGLRVNGRMVLATIDPAGSFTIDPSRQFFAQNHRILGATHNGLPYLVQALELAAQGAVTPMVELFDSEQVTEAVDRVAVGDVRFRAVVTY